MSKRIGVGTVPAAPAHRHRENIFQCSRACATITSGCRVHSNGKQRDSDIEKERVSIGIFRQTELRHEMLPNRMMRVRGGSQSNESHEARSENGRGKCREGIGMMCVCMFVCMLCMLCVRMWTSEWQ